MYVYIRVLHWQPHAGHTVNNQILTEVSNCVESINGVKEGKYRDFSFEWLTILKCIILVMIVKNRL